MEDFGKTNLQVEENYPTNEDLVLLQMMFGAKSIDRNMWRC